MMYKKNFVAAIKVGGKVLRESDDRVELPFGSEYSILFKNLNSVRALVSVQIDGQDAITDVVIQPNSEIEIERFLRSSGSLDQGNRFKFIERTRSVEDHRGIKADDGLVRIEFKREKVYEAPKIVEHHTYHYDHYPWYRYNSGPIWVNNSQTQSSQMFAKSGGLRRGGITGQSVSASDGEAEPIVAAMYYSGSPDALPVQDFANSASLNDVGITVAGSVSNQRFVPVQGFECEQPEVIVLHLVGRNGLAPIKVAKTVRAKLSCETCGTKNKSSSKFCKECGTSLEKV